MSDLSFDMSGRVGYSPLYYINRILKELIKKEWLDMFSRKKNGRLKVSVEWLNQEYSYKQLYEAYHVCYFCLALHKRTGEKRQISMGDCPDIVIISDDRIMLLEVFEAFDYQKSWSGKEGNIDAKSWVQNVWEKKWLKSYQEWTSLLIVNRIRSWPNWFNLTDVVKEVNNKDKYKRPYCAIRLDVFTDTGTSSFFKVFSKDLGSGDCLKSFDFNIKSDKGFLY